MPISYNKLWKLLIDKQLKRKDLKVLCDLSSNVIAKLGKNEAVSMESLEKICNKLECNIGDVVEFIQEEKRL